MHDKLKDFVELNRHAFDSAEAPAALASIQAKVAAKKSIVSTKLSKIMIKFSIGATSIVATSLIVQHYFAPKNNLSPNHKAITTASVIMDSAEYKVVENSPQLNTKQAATASSSENTLPMIGFTPAQNDTDIAPVPLVSAIPMQVPIVQKQNVQDGNYTDTLFSGIKKIKVRLDYCAIELLKSSDNNVHLQAYLSESCQSTITMGRTQYSKSIAHLKQEVIAGELSLWTEVETTKERRKIEQNEKPSKITLLVPDNLVIEVESGSGSVVADGISTQSLRLEAHFGSITGTNLKGDLSLIANSGSVKGQNLSGQIRVRTEFGSIKLDQLKGATDINSSSGSVTLNDVEGNLEVRSNFGSQKLSNITGNVKSISASGSVKMTQVKGDVYSVSSFGTQFYDNIKGEITAQSSSGSIQLNDVNGKLNLTTSFGSIKGANVMLVESANLKASSGSIRLDFLNTASELSYDLSSSSGSISVEQDGNKITGSDDLKVGTGKLVVNGVTTFGSQSYRLQNRQ